MNSRFTLPKGPWTTQLTSNLPQSFCEAEIHKYTEKKDAKKHFIRGYCFFKSSKVKQLLLHYGDTNIYMKGKVNASMRSKVCYNVSVVG